LVWHAGGVSELSPTARALRALEVLQARPGISADQLADRLGVTDRAARRYVAILREAGIPVESTRGRYGGYTLGRGLRLPPLVFTATEALGLVMAALEGHRAASDSADPVGSALGKILRVLPENVGRQAVTMREHAQAAPERRSTRPDPETTSALVAAVAAQERVEIGYRSATGTPRDLLVDPWAVVVRHGLWYLLCRADHVDAVRTYRVDRVRSVRATGERCDVPADLDPVTTLETHLASGWEHETRVVPSSAVTSTRRSPARRPRPRTTSMPAPLAQSTCPESSYCETQLSRRASSASGSTSTVGLRPPRWLAAAATSRGRSSALLGMHAQ
jgi:predicted DNA-binding transcriptional regulator YafY